MASYTDYQVSISTTDPVLIDLLIKVQSEEMGFLEAFSKTEKDRLLSYFQPPSLENYEDRVDFSVGFDARWGIDERVFDAIYYGFCEVDPKLRLEVLIDDEATEGRVYYHNGTWDSYEDEEEEKEEEEEDEEEEEEEEEDDNKED